MAIERELKLKITQEKKGEALTKITSEASQLSQKLIELKKEILQIRKEHGTGSQEYVDAKKKEIDITEQLKKKKREVIETEREYNKEIKKIQNEIKQDSKFGAPGSINQIQQQVLMYKQLAKSVKDGSEEQQKYIQKVREGEKVVKDFYREIRTGSRNASYSTRELLELAENITVTYMGLKAFIGDIFGAGKEIYNLGNNLGLLRESFKGVADREGKDAVQTLQLLKEATGDTVSELKLLQIASKGKFLDVDLKAIPELLSFATVRAKEMGVEVDYMVDSIVTGLGRKSPLILDNLGLKMDQLDAAIIKVAKSHGLHIDKVGELERQMFLTEAAVLVAREEMEKSTISIDNEGFAADRLKANLEDLKAEYGEVMSKAVNPFIETILESSDGMKVAGGSAIYLGEMLAGILPIIAQLKIAFPALGTSIATSLGPLSAAAAAIYFIISMVQELQSELELADKWQQRVAENQASNELFNEETFRQQDALGPNLTPDKLQIANQDLINEIFNNPTPNKTQYGPSKSEWENQKKNAKDLKKEYEELNKEKDKKPSGSKGSSGPKRTKEEKDINQIISERIQLIKDEMELYKLTEGDRGSTIETGLKALTDYYVSLGDAQKNNLPLLREIKAVSDEIKKNNETELIKQDEIIKELEKKLELNKDIKGAAKEITTQLEEEKKRREEILGIIQATATSMENMKPALNFDDESFKVASQGLDEINAKFLKALGETGADVFEDALTQGIEGALLSAFGGKADSILQKFLLKMAQNIIKTFSDLLSNAIIKFFINLFSSFLPGVGQLLGFATGGAANASPSGPALAGLTGPGTSLGRILNTPSAQTQSSQIINNLITTTVRERTNFVEHPYIAETRIDGKDIKVALKRTDKIENPRTG